MKVLIANRGEIACRILRACKTLGYETVAVYSEADAELAHVQEAEEAIAIGPPPARESYLVQDTIIQAARDSGADAVHPGYGFLSENAEFAAAVEAAGLTWVGPKPETIRAMGDKQRAREIAQEAGVPIVPGSSRFIPGALDGLQAAGAEVGYPLLVKAAAGGGGIGMRQVDSADKLLDVATATQSMAERAFGNGDIFLERAIPKARHIEIQVFGYGDENPIHLYERDCSLQRRFQKVIEETPAPGLPDEVRQKLTDAALALCRATRYANAGTIEFIVDAESFDFYFLEMNTRIQVEHPVTEQTTGLDLVAMQLAYAAGDAARVTQSDISVNGHAIECRLYAENPKKMFFPAPGTLERFKLPTDMDGVRIDTGYREGDAVTPHYDPMVAKVIAHGSDRQQAIARGISALQACQIDGLTTNRDFLIACLKDEQFQAGDVHTKFIETRGKALLSA